ncbi:MAG TPA: zinc-ribbon domain-containing protein [Tenuifilaceae bacterium]|nr:zinc-ribbon domain-containing protein [Tenuifilaceae bacterium]HOZ13382.1 zinc-ribbon domain-containing protein [Tenuifilaceae bacterium]HPI45779.1 zinc-ribbon domain-containing protein [Tenuifilaceae bacterium]HPN23059.1 zinc-ribbon domain-containing protein [Tenuifilaceae bacterium]HPV57411.1 zinc-ribbon domain-containing protein [Tenuifilaceae bacterium]
MKTCPNCNAEVEDNFDICWKCQYCFADEKILDSNDFKNVCPKCGTEVDSSKKYCPECHFDLSELISPSEEKPTGTKNINCLRCNTPMEYSGLYKFHEGTRVGALGDIFELFTNRETFEIYHCPKCGKIEFFMPYLD